jgi:hypothetical protein
MITHEHQSHSLRHLPSETKKGTQDELDWSSLTGSDYEKHLENLPSRLCFLIHLDTHDHTVKIWSSFLNLYRFVTLEIHEFSNIVIFISSLIFFYALPTETYEFSILFSEKRNMHDGIQDNAYKE